MARGRPISRKVPGTLRTWEGLSAAEQEFIHTYLDTANAQLAYETAFPEAGSANRNYAIRALLHDPRIERNIFHELTARMYRGAILGTKVIMELALDSGSAQHVRLAAAVALRAPYMSHFTTQKVSNADLSLSEQSIDQLRDLVNSLETQRGDAAKPVQADIDLLKELE